MVGKCSEGVPRVEQMDGESTGSWNWHQRQLLTWHKKSNCLRSGPIRFICVVLGLVLAGGIGAVLWKSGMESLEQEFNLKCENRKEVGGQPPVCGEPRIVYPRLCNRSMRI